MKKTVLLAAILTVMVTKAQAKEVVSPSFTVGEEKLLSADKNILDTLIQGKKVSVVGKYVKHFRHNGKDQTIEVLGLESNGQDVVGFKYGELFIIGNVFDKNGANLAVTMRSKVIPQKDYSDIVSKIEENGLVIEEGSPSAKKVIYVFSEPVCPACKSFSQRIKSLIASGKLRVKWVFVSFLSKDSVGKIAAIVKSKNPAQTVENNYKTLQGHNGGVEPLKVVPKDIKTKIDFNNRLMRKAKFRGTPTVLHKKKDKWVKWSSNSLDELLK